MRSAPPRRVTRRSRFLTGLLSIFVALSIFIAPPATALVFVSLSPFIPDAAVGQTVPGTFGLNNNNTPPDDFPVQFSNILFYPACGPTPPTPPTTDCANGLIEDVYELSPTGTGQSIPPGNATCEGTWTLTEVSPGVWRLTPPGGEGTLVLNPGETCLVNFTATPTRVPTVDVNPALPEVQTFHASGADPLLLRPPAQGGNLQLPRRGDALESTVFQGPTEIATVAAQQAGTPGQNLGTTTDTATLSPEPPNAGTGVPPTGTITFNLFGPNDPACVGPPVNTQTVPVNGYGDYTTPTPVPITQAGTYSWVATYSGDANYEGDANACGEPAETITFAQAQPTLVTNAPAMVAVGQSVSDDATLSGGVNPTGTITFNLYGPNDANCTGTPVFTSTVPVNGNGTYNSGPSPPIMQAGTYRWTADYSGDANNAPASSPCNAPNEVTQVGPVTPTIVTQATPTAQVGEPITDTATVTGVPNVPPPTGTVTFTLFGPNDPNCAGPPIFTSANRPLGGGPPPTATSEPFTPQAPGEYRWIAAYSGDANYNPATTACNDPNETTVVQQAQAQIVTQATPTAQVGEPITDTATVTGAPNAPPPTGTVTFTLFGPNDPNCAGPPIFTSANRPLGGGPPPTATSEPFTPQAPGEYRWIAAYSGDANYAPATTACNDPNETTVVQQAAATIVTQATPTAQIGEPITDTATVTGAPNAPPPTGTVTFTLFGPNDPNCAGPPIFTSANRPLGGGPPPTATSEPFTPTAPGEYRWIAAYSGDANYAPATTACNDPNETSVVQQAQPQIVTQATGPVTLGQAVSDDAILSGGVNPTGTITFNLYGPNDPNCTGPPVFTSTVPVNGNGTYNSGPFTPTQPGSYQWTADYSGDANNAPASSACGAPNETSVVTPLPTIQVIKDVDPASRPEPGGDFTYTVTVTNTSNEPLTITSLTDSVYGDLATRPGSTCGPLIGTTLQPGQSSVPCTFTAPFTGNAGDSLTDVVTVRAVNPNGVEVTDTDDATVTITPLAPAVMVEKTANPTSRPEPGGDFTYTVVVTNTSTVESLTITSLTDDVYGDLTTRPNSTCNTAVGTVLAPAPGPGNTFTCQFTAPFTGNAGDSLTDTVTVTGVDDDGDTATDTDDATVSITGVPPAVTIEKTANPLTRPEPGGDFTYTVVVTNTSTVESLTITSLTDDVYGDLTTRPNSTCNTAIGTVLQPGGTYTCQFTAPFTGPPGATQTDVVTVTAVDDDGDTATDSDDATVAITNILPQIIVEKDANPSSRPEPGGEFTFNVRVTNNGPNAVTITSLTDDVYGDLTTRPNSTCNTAIGTVLQPGQSFTCQFTATFTGNAGASQTDVVTATAVDASGDTATDSDDARITITGVAPTVNVEKSANPTSRPEPGGDFTYTVVVTNTSSEPVTITSLTDSVYGDLTTRPNSTCNTAVGTVLQPGGTFTCQFTAPFTGDGGASLTDVVTAVAVDDDGDTATDSDDATVTITGVPPTVQVEKTANPTSRPEPGGTFTFTVVVTNTSNEPVTITSLVDDIHGDLNGRGTCATGAVLPPGGTYTCSFSAPFTGGGGDTQTDVVTVVVVDNEGDQATDEDSATIVITDVPPTVQVEKTANPTSRPEPGGTFTFTVVVTNTSNEPVTITSLVDDVHGNLNGQGTCAVGATLQPGQTYTCEFTGTFTGEGGDSQRDVVTVTVVDDEGVPVSDSDDAVVTIVDVLPTITVTKTADPTSRVAPGGTFTFTVVVTNTSSEPVTITSLVDDVYGDLNGRGTCAVGATLAPNASYSCRFDAEFTGPPNASQTDVVTVTAVDDEGNVARAQARATVTLTAPPPPPPPPPPPVQPPLPRTGSESGEFVQLATVMVIVGTLLIAGSFRWPGTLAFAGAPARTGGPLPPADPPVPHRGLRRGGGDALASGIGLAAGAPRHRSPFRLM